MLVVVLFRLSPSESQSSLKPPVFILFVVSLSFLRELERETEDILFSQKKPSLTRNKKERKDYSLSRWYNISLSKKKKKNSDRAVFERGFFVRREDLLSRRRQRCRRGVVAAARRRIRRRLIRV